jgi:hypothetical protein
MSERPTVRPVTLGRLVELTHLAESGAPSTEEVSERLNVTERRARETGLEALRINLVEEGEATDEDRYSATKIGEAFLEAVRSEDWTKVSDILSTRSPHYGAFLDIIEEDGPATLDELLEKLETALEHDVYDFNQTGIEVVGDWGERLGVVQRNAFSGDYYPVHDEAIPPNFPHVVLSVYDDLEEKTGVNLRQRYLSVPELREYTCERLLCSRSAFDVALETLASRNVGKIELSGAPMDSGAKEAQYGVKEIALGGEEHLVSTTQSTERVMAGLEQFDKQYYYLAVYDRDLTFDVESTHE